MDKLNNTSDLYSSHYDNLRRSTYTTGHHSISPPQEGSKNNKPNYRFTKSSTLDEDNNKKEFSNNDDSS
jgi:hypothetical protein